MQRPLRTTLAAIGASLALGLSGQTLAQDSTMDEIVQIP